MSPVPPTVSVSRSPMDGRLFLAYPHDSGALSQSFDKLQLMDDGGSDLVSVISSTRSDICPVDGGLKRRRRRPQTPPLPALMMLCLNRGSSRTPTPPPSGASPK